MNLDEAGKDSWRHIQAGSDLTAIGSGDRIVLIKPVRQAATLEEIARLIGDDYDIIVAEGFKQSDVPKIEVHRREIGPPLSGVRRLVAIATDEPLQTEARQFSLEDAKGIADFIETEFIRRGSGSGLG